MSKQRVEVLVIGAGRHQQKIKAAIYKALDGEFSEAAKWSFPDRSTSVEISGPARELSLQVMSVSIDNDQLDSPPQESNEYWRHQLSSGVASVEALQGCVTGYAIDPLEAAIESTTRVMRDERESMAQVSMTVGGDIPSTSLYGRMGEHLDKLLAIQIERVTANE